MNNIFYAKCWNYISFLLLALSVIGFVNILGQNSSSVCQVNTALIQCKWVYHSTVLDFITIHIVHRLMTFSVWWVILPQRYYKHDCRVHCLNAATTYHDAWFLLQTQDRKLFNHISISILLHFHIGKQLSKSAWAA